MVYSSYKKQRILYYYLKGYKSPSIQKLLFKEKLFTTGQGVNNFLKNYKKYWTISRQPGYQEEITREIKDLVNQQLQKDDETTAHQLHHILYSLGHNISRRTILRCRTDLGWTFHGSAYCQLI